MKGRLTNWNNYPEVTAYVAEICHGRLIKETVDMVNEKFGTSFTLMQIRGYMRTHGLKTGLGKSKKGVRYVWTPEMDSYLIEHKDEPNRKVADDMNALFSRRTRYRMDFSENSVSRRKGKLGIVSVYSGKFEKGSKPATYKPLGTEMLRGDGTWWVKVKDGSHEEASHNWKQKSHVMWEEANGPIPDGKIIGFKDGNPTNCILENLMLIDQSENVVMSRWKVRHLPEEVREIGINAARLTAAVAKRQKEGKQ